MSAVNPTSPSEYDELREAAWKALFEVKQASFDRARNVDGLIEAAHPIYVAVLQEQAAGIERLKKLYDETLEDAEEFATLSRQAEQREAEARRRLIALLKEGNWTGNETEEELADRWEGKSGQS